MKYLLLLLPLILLTSCAGKMTETTVERMFDASGNVITETTTTVAEASVKKEQAVHKTLQKYLETVAASGVRMSWQEVKETHYYDGMSGPVTVVRHMPTFSYVDPSAIQKLPTEPSQHPVWQAGRDVLLGAAKYGLIGFGIHEAAGVLAAGVDGAGDIYNGEVQMTNSRNVAGRDMNIREETTTIEAPEVEESLEVEE